MRGIYDPVTGNKWADKGKRPRLLVGKRREDYAINAIQTQAWLPPRNDGHARARTGRRLQHRCAESPSV
jgi:hypothetical protein